MVKGQDVMMKIWSIISTSLNVGHPDHMQILNSSFWIHRIVTVLIDSRKLSFYYSQNYLQPNFPYLCNQNITQQYFETAYTAKSNLYRQAIIIATYLVASVWGN